MIETALLIATIILVILTFVGLYRAVVGPTVEDRMVAINMIATKVTTIIVMIALLQNQKFFVDVALVYALLGFITTIGLAKLLMKGKLGK
ncbi:cation:proton antiporter [Hujiaoplasma nucleasis]|uniref:Cation:proton antiporter n=1 Tax=Hujiaoplasma nucleasis TaxID=2725268 RepID=A0A7L6N4Q7_9MOLU|nr:monovalent cation/H+ antiporter complex subunit F [Hujiaoplasma nucleasis]QLY40228.1 cation:proton antiporter [Hujiaoplasma nucleasis]